MQVVETARITTVAAGDAAEVQRLDRLRFSQLCSHGDGALREREPGLRIVDHRVVARHPLEGEHELGRRALGLEERERFVPERGRRRVAQRNEATGPLHHGHGRRAGVSRRRQGGYRLGQTVRRAPVVAERLQRIRPLDENRGAAGMAWRQHIDRPRVQPLRRRHIELHGAVPGERQVPGRRLDKRVGKFFLPRSPGELEPRRTMMRDHVGEVVEPGARRVLDPGDHGGVLARLDSAWELPVGDVPRQRVGEGELALAGH